MHWERTATVRSPATVARLWDAIVDGRRWSFWHAGFEWMWLEGPLEKGAIATIKARGVRQTAFTVREVVPEQRLAFETTFGPVARVRIAFDLASLEGASSVTYGVTVDGPLGNLAVRMIGRRLAAGADEALARLGEYALAPEQPAAEKEEAR